MFGRRTNTATVLSFRADGPYWTDLIHLLAYPEGITYIWPFRYNRARVSAALLSVFDDARRRRRLKNSPILIAARFHSGGAENRVLPIRLARVIHVGVATGIYSVTFRLGRSVDFSNATDLSSCTFATS